MNQLTNKPLIMSLIKRSKSFTILLFSILVLCNFANSQDVNDKSLKELQILADSLFFYNIDNTQASAIYQKLAETYDSLQSWNQFLRSKSMMACAQTHLGHVDRAIDIAEEVINQARLLNQPFNVNLAYAYYAKYYSEHRKKWNRQTLIDNLYSTLDQTTKIPGSSRQQPNAFIYYRLGLAYQNQEDLYLANKYYEKAIEADQDKLLRYQILKRMVYSLTFAHRYEEAAEKADELLSITIQIGPESRQHADALIATAHNKQSMGLLREGLNLHKKGLDIYSSILESSESDLLMTQMDHGYFYLFSGDYDVAANIIQTAVDGIRKYHGENLYWISGMNNLAAINRMQGNLNQALVIQREVIKKAPYTTDLVPSQIAEFHDTMGHIYFELGQNDSALYHYNIALAKWENTMGADDYEYAQTLNKVSRLKIAQGQYKEGIELSLKVRDIVKRISQDNWRMLLSYYSPLSYGYYLDGQMEKAKEVFSEDNAFYIDYIRKYFSSMTEHQRKKFYETFEQYISGYLTIGSQLASGDSEYLDELLHFQQQTKGILLNSELAVKQKIKSLGDTAIFNLYNNVNQLKTDIGNYSKLSDTELDNLHISLDSLKDLLSNKEEYLMLATNIYGDKPDLKSQQEISVMVKRKEAVLELIKIPIFDFSRMKSSDSTIYAGILMFRKPDKNQLIIINDGNQVDKIVNTIYQNSQKYQLKESMSYETMWRPFENELEKTKRIFISNDGAYHKINLQTLMNPDGTYLMDRFQFINVPSVNSIEDYRQTISLRKLNGRSNEIVVIGNPIFNFQMDSTGTRGSQYSNLPGTEEEVKSIVGLFRTRSGYNANSLTQEQASELNLKQIKSPLILHIATHGYFDVNSAKKDPLLGSGLLLNGAGDSFNSSIEKWTELDDDGILTSYEAQALNLDDTELVILSACETGLGTIENGQGVYGLQRSFKKAGAHFMIMSLWKVNDQVTQELMTAFYDNWINGESLREAFQNAQDEIKEKYKHPFYWGAFVLI